VGNKRIKTFHVEHKIKVMEILMSIVRGFKTEKSTIIYSNVDIPFAIPDNAKRFQDYFDTLFEDKCDQLPNWYSKVVVMVDGSFYTHDLGKVVNVNGNVQILKNMYYLIFKECFIKHFIVDNVITDPRALSLTGSKAPLTKSEAIGKLQTFAKGAVQGLNDLKTYNNALSNEVRAIFAGSEATEYKSRIAAEKKATKKLTSGK
jgi:hypothetical protein